MPMFPPNLGIVVAHVDEHGEPCNEGTTPEAHGAALGDYPHEEVLDDPELWDDEEPAPPLPEIIDSPPAVAPQSLPEKVTLHARKKRRKTEEG